MGIKSSVRDTQDMDLKISNADGAVTVTVVGKLNTTTAPQFNAETDKALAGAKSITLDLKDLEFISSAGIRSIMTIRSRIGGDNMHIINAGGLVKEVFEVSGISAILEN